MRWYDCYAGKIFPLFERKTSRRWSLTSDDDNGEDKMEKGARREGKTAWDVAKRYISVANHEAYDVLKLIKPDYLVRATDYNSAAD